MIDITDKPEKVLEDLEEANKEAHGTKRAEWRKALRRLRGDQSDDVPSAIDEVTDPEQPQRQVINILNLSYRNYVSFLARALPRLRNIQGIAASREAPDLRAAYSVQRMLRHELLGHRGRYVDEIERLVSFAFCCHTGFCLVEGVKRAGQRYGEVELYSGPAFDFLWYPHVRQWRRSPVFAARQRMTKEEILERWGVDDKPKNKLTEAMKKGEGAKYEDDSGVEEKQPGASKTVYEITRLWFRKGEAYPNGAQRLLLGGKHILDIKDGDKHSIDTPDGEYPVVSLGDVPLGYYDYGYSRMEQIADPQRAYNEQRSRIIQAMLEHPVITVLVPSQSGITQDKMTNRPWAMIPWTGIGGTRPQVEGPPDMSPAFSVLGAFKAEIEDVHAQTPMARGQPQGSRMPVGTAQALLERAEGQDYVLIDSMRNAISEIAERIIIEGRRVWPESKVFNVLGAHRRYEAMEFRKAELTEGFSVRVQPDDSLPRSSTQRWEKVTQAVQAQMMSPAHARKLLEVLDDEDEYSVNQLHEQRAYDDFLLLKEGAQAGVSIFDDHTVHIEAEERYANEEMAATGQRLPEKFASALEAHRQEHISMQQRKNAELQAMQEVPPPPIPEGEDLGMQQMPEGQGAMVGAPSGLEAG